MNTKTKEGARSKGNPYLFSEYRPWYLTMTGRELFPDKTVPVYDKTGSVTNKP